MHTPDEKGSRLLQGAYDLHVHCSPDVVARSQDFLDLAAAAHAVGMAGIGIKDHTTSTLGRCYALNRIYPDGPRFISSLALNPPVGGLNPAAVEAALSSGVDIIYFPTYSAAHHIDTLGEEITPVPHPPDGCQRISIDDSDGNVSAAAISIVELIASHDAVLATGHLSPRESLILLELAAERGARTVVTHASQSVPAMSVSDQQFAVRMGALIEHSFLAVTECCPGRVSLQQIAEQIREVGHENVILSSDFGQSANGPPVEAFMRQLIQLRSLGFSEVELRCMISTNPHRLIAKGR